MAPLPPNIPRSVALVPLPLEDTLVQVPDSAAWVRELVDEQDALQPFASTRRSQSRRPKPVDWTPTQQLRAMCAEAADAMRREAWDLRFDDRERLQRAAAFTRRLVAATFGGAVQRDVDRLARIAVGNDQGQVQPQLERMARRYMASNGGSAESKQRALGIVEYAQRHRDVTDDAVRKRTYVLTTIASQCSLLLGPTSARALEWVHKIARYARVSTDTALGMYEYLARQARKSSGGNDRVQQTNVPPWLVRSIIDFFRNQRHQLDHDAAAYLRTWIGAVQQYLVDRDYPPLVRWMASTLL